MLFKTWIFQYGKSILLSKFKYSKSFLLMEQLSSGKLAIIQGVHKSAVSSRLKKLEEKGLVTSES